MPDPSGRSSYVLHAAYLSLRETAWTAFAQSPPNTTLVVAWWAPTSSRAFSVISSSSSAMERADRRASETVGKDSSRVIALPPCAANVPYQPRPKADGCMRKLDASVKPPPTRHRASGCRIARRHSQSDARPWKEPDGDVVFQCGGGRIGKTPRRRPLSDLRR